MVKKRAADFGKKRIENPYFKRKGIKDVVLVDAFPVADGETLRLVFEAVSSAWSQGVFLMTDRGMTVDGAHCKSLRLWADEAPPEILFTCKTGDGILTLYNVWDSGRGLGSESQAETSGMLLEKTPKGIRYRCNDIGLKPDFSRLVFRIERTS